MADTGITARSGREALESRERSRVANHVTPYVVGALCVVRLVCSGLVHRGPYLLTCDDFGPLACAAPGLAHRGPYLLAEEERFFRQITDNICWWSPLASRRADNL